MHPRVEDSPSSHPMGCATPAPVCLAGSERGEWGCLQMLGSSGNGDSHREPAWLLCLTRPKPFCPLMAQSWLGTRSSARGSRGVPIEGGVRAPSWAVWGGQGSAPAPEGQAGPHASCGHARNHQHAEKPPTPGMICHQVLCVTAGLAPRRAWRWGRREGKTTSF